MPGPPGAARGWRRMADGPAVAAWPVAGWSAVAVLVRGPCFPPISPSVLRVRGCDAIAAPAFGRAHAGRLLLDYHDERSGTFGLLRLVPGEKVVVLGLVTTKTSRAGRPEQIESRLREASSLISPGRLAVILLSGFAASVAGNAITPRHNSPSSPLLVRAARELPPARTYPDTQPRPHAWLLGCYRH